MPKGPVTPGLARPRRPVSPDVAAVLAYQKTPGPDTADTALKSIAPVLRMGAKVYGGGDGPIMFGRARKIALSALPRYDPEKSALNTYLMSHLRGLQRERARMESPVTAPERVMADRRAVARADSELRDDMGRAPTAAEIADHTGLSLSKIERARRYRPGTTTGELLDRALAQGGDEHLAVEPPDTTPARAEYLYHGAAPLDQLILEHTLGLHGAPVLPKGEIARRAGVSPPRVSQRAAALQKQLDELERHLGF